MLVPNPEVCTDVWRGHGDGTILKMTCQYKYNSLRKLDAAARIGKKTTDKPISIVSVAVE